MSAPTAADRRPQWWSVIGYEVSMLRGLQELEGFRIIPPTKGDPVRSSWLLRNNTIEGRVLHKRNLYDFCTSKQNRDIKPSDLFDDYNTDPKYDTLKRLTKHLAQQYGNNVPGNPRWAFNKMLAHPTKERDSDFNYDPFLERVVPVLQEIIGEMETLRGRPFPALPEITQT
jgi:hypothetical protein